MFFPSLSSFLKILFESLSPSICYMNTPNPSSKDSDAFTRLLLETPSRQPLYHSSSLMAPPWTLRPAATLQPLSSSLRVRPSGPESSNHRCDSSVPKPRALRLIFFATSPPALRNLSPLCPRPSPMTLWTSMS